LAKHLEAALAPLLAESGLIVARLMWKIMVFSFWLRPEGPLGALVSCRLVTVATGQAAFCQGERAIT
jgi:hypothetical protein